MLPDNTAHNLADQSLGYSKLFSKFSLIYAALRVAVANINDLFFCKFDVAVSRAALKIWYPAQVMFVTTNGPRTRALTFRRASFGSHVLRVVGVGS